MSVRIKMGGLVCNGCNVIVANAYSKEWCEALDEAQARQLGEDTTNEDTED